MQYLLRLTDSSAQRMIVLTLEERMLKVPAVDFVFDVVGHPDPEDLIEAGVLSAGQTDDLKAFQQMIFDRDEQGPFIRDGITFSLNGKELNPDAPMISAFVKAERDGSMYMRCDLVVSGEEIAPPSIKSSISSSANPPENASLSNEDMIKEFARIFFLHKVSIGAAIDVTKQYPELTQVIKHAEKKGWIEVDVKKVAYKLTPEGKREHERYIQEAQDLIRRFDIYADVDVDSLGKARFDTGLGKDFRVPALEMEGVDPFRARFLIGINDGEWDNLEDWMDLFENPEWYAEVFEPVERAPSVEDIGRERMSGIIDQAKSALRRESGQY